MTTKATQGVPFSEVAYWFTPDFWSDLILDMLHGRAEMSKSARQSLNSAIKDRVRIDGFRDASRAEPMLVEPYVVDVIREGDDRIVGAFLRAWAAAKVDLRRTVEEHLAGQGMPTAGPNMRKRCFDEIWSHEVWERETEAVLSANDGLDEGEVALMLCYISGNAPEDLMTAPEVESPLLREWLELLERLPGDAPEWKSMEAFAVEAISISRGKALEMFARLSTEFRKSMAEMKLKYAAELSYLEIDLRAGPIAESPRPARMGEAAELGSRLSDELEAYHQVRPQAASRTEELARAASRAKHEGAILEIVGEWERLIEAIESEDDQLAETEEDSFDDGHDAQASTTEVQDAEYQELVSDRDRLERELESIKADFEGIRADNEELRRTEVDLRADRNDLYEENNGLKDEITETRRLAGIWRKAYVDSQVGMDAEEDLPPLTKVREAVDRARDRFPNQLLFALNSKSDKNSQFLRPDEVYGALEWLATDYHQLRKDPPGKAPPFDRLLKGKCPGWSYKPQQAARTKEMFNDWYTTEVDGRVYELGAHLGKGTDRDPQTTMRIAFAWDDEAEKVIVGYIGPHQRNRRA